MEAQSHFESAITLDPEHAQSRCIRTACLTAAAGYMQQALREHEDTYRLSPGNATTLIIMAFLHLQFGQDGEALKCVDLAAGLGFAGVALPVPFIRAQVEQRRGRYTEAARQMHHVAVGVSKPREAAALIDTVYSGLAGHVSKSDAAAAIRTQTLSSDVAVLNPVRFARPLLLWASSLGDLDLAYDIADTVLQDFRRSGMVRVSVGFQAQLWMPELYGFRRDRRFQRFVAGLGLVEFWSHRGPPDHCTLRDGNLICH